MEWDGLTLMPFVVGIPIPDGSILVCKIFKVPPICIATCGTQIYYVFGSVDMTHACVHLRLYKHPMKADENQEFKERTRAFIGKQVKRTPMANYSTIVMEATKELVDEFLLDPIGAPIRKYDLKELVFDLDKYKYMSFPSIKNNITALRYIHRFGIMDSIAILRGCSH